MPRYFFDIKDGRDIRDEVGTVLPDLNAARMEAMKSLPDIAREEIPKGGDRQTFVVLVTDDDGHAVYSAAMTYVGQWLIR